MSITSPHQSASICPDLQTPFPVSSPPNSNKNSTNSLSRLKSRLSRGRSQGHHFFSTFLSYRSSVANSFTSDSGESSSLGGGGGNGMSKQQKNSAAGSSIEFIPSSLLKGDGAKFKGGGEGDGRDTLTHADHHQQQQQQSSLYLKNHPDINNRQRQSIPFNPLSYVADKIIEEEGELLSNADSVDLFPRSNNSIHISRINESSSSDYLNKILVTEPHTALLSGENSHNNNYNDGLNTKRGYNEDQSPVQFNRSGSRLSNSGNPPLSVTESLLTSHMMFGKESILFTEVYEPEINTNNLGGNETRDITLGGGSPTQGTRHRIRARASMRFEDFEDIEDEIFDDGLADGLLISAEEVQAIRRRVWCPQGEIPPPYTVTMSYHTAWDVGKKGCIALKLRNEWDASVNPDRLRFFVMDGTDPVSFLSFYTKGDLRLHRGDPNQKKGVVRAEDIRDGIWNCSKGRIKFRRSDKKSRLMIVDRLPPHFIQAIIVCIREMETYREVNKTKSERYVSRREMENKMTQRKLDRRRSAIGNRGGGASISETGGGYHLGSTASAVNCGNNENITSNNKGEFISKQSGGGGDGTNSRGMGQLEDQSGHVPAALTANRVRARALVVPSNETFASAVAFTIKQKKV